MSDLPYEGLRSLIEFPNYHAIYYSTRNVRVSVRGHPRLIFKDISTVKEFTNVAANVEVDEKLAARVLRPELPHIEDHIVEDNEFFPSRDHLIEFVAGDPLVDLPEGLLFFLIKLVKDLESGQKDKEKADFQDN